MTYTASRGTLNLTQLSQAKRRMAARTVISHKQRRHDRYSTVWVCV